MKQYSQLAEEIMVDR